MYTYVSLESLAASLPEISNNKAVSDSCDGSLSEAYQNRIRGSELTQESAMLYEGNVSFVMAKNGPQISRDNSGKFNADNASSLLDAIIDINKGIMYYSLWIDGKEIEAKDGLYSTTQLKMMRKEAKTIELVHVRKPFPQPKLKLTFGTGSASKSKVVKLA